MRSYKVLLILITAVILFSLLVGCSGISQGQYDSLRTQLGVAQAQVT